MKGRENNKRSAWTLSVICGIFAALTLSENILDLTIPLPLGWKWVIFAALALLCLVFSIRALKSNTKSDPDKSEVTPPQSHTQVVVPTPTVRRPTGKRLPKDNNIIQYMISSEQIPHVNTFHVFAGIFSLSLTKSTQLSTLGEPLVNQTIHWTLEGNNVSYTPMTSLSMAIMLSTFTSWRDGAVDITAKLTQKNGTQVFLIEHDQITCQTVNACEDLRLLTFPFPEGVTCKRAEPFIFEITLTWNRGCHFRDLEHYYTDPKNYAKHVDKLSIEVQTNIDQLMDRNYQLYRLNRGSSLMVPCSAAHKNRDTKTIRWMVSPQKNELYVIEITAVS